MTPLQSLIKEREEAFEKDFRKELQKTLNEYFPKVHEEGEEKRLMKRGEALVLYGEAVSLSRKQDRTTIRKTLEAVFDELIMSMPRSAENLSNLTPDNAKATIDNFTKRLSAILYPTKQ